MSISPKESIMQEKSVETIGEKIKAFKIDDASNYQIVRGVKVRLGDTLSNKVNSNPYYCFKTGEEGATKTKVYFYYDYKTEMNSTPEGAEDYIKTLIRFGKAESAERVDLASITKAKPSFVQDVVLKEQNGTPPSVAQNLNGQTYILKEFGLIEANEKKEICVIFNDNFGQNRKELSAREAKAVRMLSVTQKECNSIVEGSKVNASNSSLCDFKASCEVGYKFDIVDGYCKKTISYQPKIMSVFAKLNVLKQYTDTYGRVKYTNTGMEEKAFFIGMVGEAEFTGTNEGITKNSISDMFKQNKNVQYFASSNPALLESPTIEVKRQCKDGLLVEKDGQCSEVLKLKPVCDANSMLATNVEYSKIQTQDAIAKSIPNSVTEMKEGDYMCQYRPIPEYSTILAIMPEVKVEVK